jgi:hypothetical protein
MLRLKQTQRMALGDTVRQLANIAAATLAFGQFVGQRPISILSVVIGLTLWIVLVALGVWLAGVNEDG